MAYSVVIPVFSEAPSLPEIVARIAQTFESMGAKDEFEILFVDDGSTDDTPAVIARLANEHPFVRAISFRRNFGKSLALMAGFRGATGDVIITMDGDLQDNPEDIVLLLEKLEEGYDLVGGWRRKRKDSLIRVIGSWAFNGFVAKTTGLRIHDINCGFKAYRREAIDNLCVYGQYHRYIPLQAHLLGFRVGETPVNNSPRMYGQSKYRALRYQGLFDLLSLLFISRFGLNPLHFFGVVAAAFIVPSVMMLFWFVFRQAMYWIGFGEQYLVYNRPLLAISLTALMLGVLIFLTGFVCDFILHHVIRTRIDDIIRLGSVSPSKKVRIGTEEK